LLGLILGRDAGAPKTRKEKTKSIIEEPKMKPIDPDTFGQDLNEREMTQDTRSIPRNPRNRNYY
jgi:hypothetical protein